MTNKHNYEAIVTEALTNAGKLHECYSLFHNYSLGNQWLAMMQLPQAEPINTFKGWQKLGRNVKKGEKAIALLMPVTITDKDDADKKRVIFVSKRNWFGLSQTQGAEYVAPSVPNFDLVQALSTLQITQESFQYTNGNFQGYAKPADKVIAISPLAVDAFKTSIHEIAHCLLHDSESMHDAGTLPSDVKEVEAELTAYLVKSVLGLTANLEYSRGYIQRWMQDAEQEKVRFSKVFGAVDKILKAGTQAPVDTQA